MVKHVVVIGGGYAGLRLAGSLDAHASVTVIDRNDYFHHKAAALRAMVVDGWADKVFVDFNTLGLSAEFVQADVVEVQADEKCVRTRDGRRISYDYLVVATGSKTRLKTDSLGSSGAQARAQLAPVRERYAAAKHVIIIGDGAVGVEMAGEFRDLSPELRITLVSSASEPMATLGHPGFSERVQNILHAADVDYRPGVRVTEVGDQHVITALGTRLEADVVVQAMGISLNTAWVTSFAPEWLDGHSQIRVDGALRVVGQDRVFAIGDCSNIAEPKMLKMADDQAKHLASQIIRLMAGRDALPYKRAVNKLGILPFGANDGVALLPLGKEGLLLWPALGRWLTVKAKATALLSDRFPSAYAP